MRIEEGEISIEVPDDVFYNPLQRLSRDIVVAIAKAFRVKRYCEPFAGIGLRSLRMFKEANIEEAVVNDRNPRHIEVAKRILRGYNVEFYSEDAHRLIRKLIERPCDLVDLDQFGIPRRYIDGAIMLTKPGGILTFIIPNPSDLFGTYPDKCFKRYLAYPVRASFRFERGARIALLELHRRAAMFDRHIEPLITYRHKYYLRFVVRVRRGLKRPIAWRVKYDDISFEIFEEPVAKAGPARGGKIFDKDFIGRVIEHTEGFAKERLMRLYKESSARPLYYDVHKVSGRLKVNPPKLKSLEEEGFVRTHFYKYGIRAPSLEELIKAILRRSA